MTGHSGRLTKPIIAILFLLVFIAGCTSTSGVTFQKCNIDEDCDEGEICVDNECVEDTDSDDGDLPIQDGDTADGDEPCPLAPDLPTMETPCKKYDCEEVAAPECWSCTLVPDSTKNGDPCFDDDGNDGFCSDGECLMPMPDGDTPEDGDAPDGDIPDGDEAVTECEQTGGNCYVFDDTCPEGERRAASGMGCPLEVCCLPDEEIECYAAGGFCQPQDPVSSVLPYCREGFRVAESDQGCSAFGEWCCEALDPPCVGEGEVGNTLDDNQENDICCPGLGRIANAIPDDSNNCMAPIDGSFRCGMCPDGNCGRGENFCNCPEDCAAPGECESDDQCPKLHCRNISQPDGSTICENCEANCDEATATCGCIYQAFPGFICHNDSGLCIDPQTIPCEFSGNGTCTHYVRDICPEGQQLNRDPLGCNELCCLDAECLEMGGYCTLDGSGDCDPGYSAISGHAECPGGQAGICCMPTEPPCTPLGEIGFGNVNCCNGLTMAEYVDVGDNGECYYYDCACFVCIVLGDNYCDGMNRENECNSQDCREGPMSCENDDDCGPPYCEDLLGDPSSACKQLTPFCSGGQCATREMEYVDYFCDRESGYCKSNDIFECAERGGECIARNLKCPEGTAEPADEIDCNAAERCCVPYDAVCEEDDDCPAAHCIGLSGLPDCIQMNYFCLEGNCEGSETRMENAYCDEDSGRCTPFEDPECVELGGYCTQFMEDCDQGYHEAIGTLGCPGGYSGKCCLPDDLNECEQYGGICIAIYPGSECPDEYSEEVPRSCGGLGSQCCMSYNGLTCQRAGGYCIPYAPGSSCNPGDTPVGYTCGGSGATCCFPGGSDPCIGEGEMGSMFDQDYCCEGLSKISNSWPDETGACVALPDGSFYCTRCGNGVCGPGENACNCSDDCTSGGECLSDIDCLDHQWNIYCLGHWDCIDGRCAPECGEPCGNGVCEPEEGESQQSCDDCRDTPDVCRSDADCPEQYCQDLPTGMPRCSEVSYTCMESQCVDTEITYEMSFCDYESGSCYSMNPSCSDIGGICAGWTSGCPDGMHMTEGDCGDLVCAGGCICCVADDPEPETCNELGGVCEWIISSCPPDYGNDSRESMGCSMLQRCCLP